MRVTALYRHPIKSTRAHRLERARLDAWGFEDDRRMMLVDENGRFVTARKHPELARCWVERSGAMWRVQHPTHGELTFDDERRETLEVEVWGDDFLARLGDPKAATWFSELLGRELRLVHQAHESHRRLDPDYVSEERETVFADGYPVLIASEASLAALNDALEDPVDMLRFRPNIVVDGDTPWDEDSWRQLEIGGQRFEAVKACVRCSLTGVDPVSAQTSPEPLKTLGRLRDEVTFGVNLVHAMPCEIAVGDEVCVSRRA